MESEQILQKIFEKMCDIEKRQMTLLEISKNILMINNRQKISQADFYRQLQEIQNNFLLHGNPLIKKNI